MQLSSVSAYCCLRLYNAIDFLVMRVILKIWLGCFSVSSTSLEKVSCFFRQVGSLSSPTPNFVG